MEEKPPQPGLKLSMITQPVDRGVLRSHAPPLSAQLEPGGVEYADSLTVVSGPLLPARPPLSTRFATNLIDLLIVLPLATALLFGLPRLVLLNDEPPDSDGNAYAALGLLIIMIPLAIPLAALAYTGLAYRITGNTAGKRAKLLTVQRRGGGPAPRSRVVSRALFKWGLPTALYFVWFAINVLLIPFNLQETTLLAWVSLISMAAPALVQLSIIILDLLLPLTRLDENSLTDIVTGTEAGWHPKVTGRIGS